MINIYSRYEVFQTYLKSNKIEGINIVDDVLESNYIINGHFKDSDYHEGLLGVIIPYTGHNGIDLEAMRRRNLQLYITPIRTKYVAEKAIALMLALLGKVVNYHNKMIKGDWSNRNNESRIPWVSVENKNIGFFGYGRIGRLVHKMLSGFDNDFYTIDRSKVYKNINLVKDLEELIEVSDILFIATPLNEKTQELFNDDILSTMKGKYIINVGRGKILEQAALYKALTNNTLAGYASDVWFNYPKGEEVCFPSDYPIHELDNVVLSNHSGGFTVNTNEEVFKALTIQLIALSEEDYSNALDLEKLI